MPFVWIVTINKKFLGVFDTIENVIASVETTYCQSYQPTLIRKEDTILEWRNGLKAKKQPLKTSADHL